MLFSPWIFVLIIDNAWLQILNRQTRKCNVCFCNKIAHHLWAHTQITILFKFIFHSHTFYFVDDALQMFDLTMCAALTRQLLSLPLVVFYLRMSLLRAYTYTFIKAKINILQHYGINKRRECLSEKAKCEIHIVMQW